VRVALAVIDHEGRVPRALSAATCISESATMAIPRRGHGGTLSNLGRRKAHGVSARSITGVGVGWLVCHAQPTGRTPLEMQPRVMGARKLRRSARRNVERAWQRPALGRTQSDRRQSDWPGRVAQRAGVHRHPRIVSSERGWGSLLAAPNPTAGARAGVDVDVGLLTDTERTGGTD